MKSVSSRRQPRHERRRHFHGVIDYDSFKKNESQLYAAQAAHVTAAQQRNS